MAAADAELVHWRLLGAVVWQVGPLAASDLSHFRYQHSSECKAADEGGSHPADRTSGTLPNVTPGSCCAGRGGRGWLRVEL